MVCFVVYSNWSDVSVHLNNKTVASCLPMSIIET